ncbi:hypothetical protein FRC17_005045, partial [Serendipita sp. 399]
MADPRSYFSYEPSLSGFSEDEYRNVPTEILVSRPEALQCLQQIEDIPAQYLAPQGPLPHFRGMGPLPPPPWEYRTPSGERPRVRYRWNDGFCDVLIEVTLRAGEILSVHVPYDSWKRRTCSAENVRAALQSAYVNLANGKRACPVIVRTDAWPSPVYLAEMVYARHGARYSHRRGREASSLRYLPLPPPPRIVDPVHIPRVAGLDRQHRPYQYDTRRPHPNDRLVRHERSYTLPAAYGAGLGYDQPLDERAIPQRHHPVYPHNHHRSNHPQRPPTYTYPYPTQQVNTMTMAAPAAGSPSITDSLDLARRRFGSHATLVSQRNQPPPRRGNSNRRRNATPSPHGTASQTLVSPEDDEDRMSYPSPYSSGPSLPRKLEKMTSAAQRPRPSRQ